MIIEKKILQLNDPISRMIEIMLIAQSHFSQVSGTLTNDFLVETTLIYIQLLTLMSNAHLLKWSCKVLSYSIPSRIILAIPFPFRIAQLFYKVSLAQLQSHSMRIWIQIFLSNRIEILVSNAGSYWSELHNGLLNPPLYCAYWSLQWLFLVINAAENLRLTFFIFSGKIRKIYIDQLSKKPGYFTDSHNIVLRSKR